MAQIIVYNGDSKPMYLHDGTIITGHSWELVDDTGIVQNQINSGKLILIEMPSLSATVNPAVAELLSKLTPPEKTQKPTPRRKKTTKEQNGRELLDTKSASNTSKPSISKERED